MFNINFTATVKKSVILTVFSLFLLSCISLLMIGSTFHTAQPPKEYLGIDSLAQTREQRINFLCRPDIAAINFDYLYYTTPNEAALDLIDEEYLEEESVFPDEETINRCESLVTLDPATTELYSNYWKKVKAE